jgi:hypothetical protein
MLQRELDRMTRALGQSLIEALREASIEELAALIPSVNQLKKQVERHGFEQKALPFSAPAVEAKPVSSRPSSSGGGANAVIEVLRKHHHGLRSEELQRLAGVDTLTLRSILSDLMASGRVLRQGKARGTRYALSTNFSSPSSSADEEEQGPDSNGPPAKRRPEPAMASPIAPPPPVVDVGEMNKVRQCLANSVVPMTVAELETAMSMDRDQAKVIVEQLVTLGLATRESAGPVVRYRLATERSGEDAPRVVRRPPRAKGWQPAAVSAPKPATNETDVNDNSNSSPGT